MGWHLNQPANLIISFNSIEHKARFSSWKLEPDLKEVWMWIIKWVIWTHVQFHLPALEIMKISLCFSRKFLLLSLYSYIIIIILLALQSNVMYPWGLYWDPFFFLINNIYEWHFKLPRNFINYSICWWNKSVF